MKHEIDYSKVGLQQVLKLMEKKYPMNIKEETNPVLVIYDDESGKIIRNATYGMYDKGNSLFEFSSISELLEHLEKK